MNEAKEIVVDNGARDATREVETTWIEVWVWALLFVGVLGALGQVIS